MFDYISGTLEKIYPGFCVIETGGIGFQIFLTDQSAAVFSRRSGEKVKVYTFLNCGSSDRMAMELFGFATAEERDFFIRLIAVSGVGPKAAMAILSALSVQDLTMCILSDDAKSIAKAQGIGLKTAQKVILELKDKVAKSASGATLAASPASSALPGVESEAVNALAVLGYSVPVAAVAVRASASEAKNLEDLIRRALKKLGDNTNG